MGFIGIREQKNRSLKTDITLLLMQLPCHFYRFSTLLRGNCKISQKGTFMVGVRRFVNTMEHFLLRQYIYIYLDDRFFWNGKPLIASIWQVCARARPNPSGYN